jgi:hypothetical protein
MSKYFLIFFILLSFITQTFAEPGVNPILSRLTPGDVFGAMALLFGLKALFLSLHKYSDYTKIYKVSFFMVLCFLIPIFFSRNLQSTLIESFVIVFLIFLSILIFYNYKDHFLEKLVPLIMYTAIIASVLGVIDYAGAMFGLPRIFPSRAGGEILSGFRNAGQAGAYFLIIVTILYPLRFSSLYKLLNAKNRKLLNISLLISIIFLALTGKITAYIGVFVGLMGYALMNRNIKTIFSLSITALILVLLFSNLKDLAPQVYNRISTKYQTRIDDRIEGNVDEDKDFITKNLSGAVQSFEDRPLIGSGLGAFYGYYGKYEVHSTYFKMLGETGILGMIGYGAFIFAFFRLLRLRKYAKSNPYADYLRTIFPFVIGCLVSWAYTYHLRKREFWILVAILLIVNYCAYVYRKPLEVEN